MARLTSPEDSADRLFLGHEHDGWHVAISGGRAVLEWERVYPLEADAVSVFVHKPRLTKWLDDRGCLGN